MKIVIAIDSMKGSLSSMDGGMAVKEGILRAMPDAQVTFAECTAEYTSQILEDDYNSVVLFAQEAGIEIPPELMDAIEED